MASTGGDNTSHTRLRFKSSWTVCGKLSFACLGTSYFPKAKFFGQEEVPEARIWLMMKMAECMAILF